VRMTRWRLTAPFDYAAPVLYGLGVWADALHVPVRRFLLPGRLRAHLPRRTATAGPFHVSDG